MQRATGHVVAVEREARWTPKQSLALQVSPALPSCRGVNVEYRFSGRSLCRARRCQQKSTEGTARRFQVRLPPGQPHQVGAMISWGLPKLAGEARCGRCQSCSGAESGLPWLEAAEFPRRLPVPIPKSHSR